MQSAQNHTINSRHVGLTPQQQLQQSISVATEKWHRTIRDYQKSIAELTDRSNDPEWYHYAMFTPRIVQLGFEGALKGGAGILHMFGTILAELYNTGARIATSDNHWKNEVQYAINNWSIMMTEGLVTTLASGGAQLGRLAGIDPDWAFDEETGIIPQVTEWASEKRFKHMVSQGGYANRKNYERFMDEARISGEVEMPNSDASPEEWENFENELHKHARARLINDYHLESTQKMISSSSELNRILNEDVIDPALSTLFLGIDKEIDPVFQNSEFYQFLSGSFQSIGNIALSWGISAVGAKYGVPPAITKMYFGASVFGRSHAEAIQAGSSMQDAFTFAASRAATEVLAQNLGGLKTHSFIPKPARDAMGRLADSSMSSLVKDMFIEGFEEFLIESGRAGQYYYVGEEKTLDIGSDQELVKNLAFAFLAGSMSSGVLAGGRNMYLQTTMPHQVARHAKAFDIDVQKHGQDVALRRFEKSMGRIVETLNNPKSKGYKTNQHDANYIGKLTHAEKQAWLNKTQLKEYVMYDNQTEQFRLRDGVQFNENMFKNTVDGQVVSQDNFAISENVRGRELQIVGKKRTVNPIEMNRLNEAGRAALAQANQDMDSAPVAIYESNSNESGFYGANGLIYVNQKNLSPTQAVATVVKHEMTHKIQTEAPQLYQELINNIDQLISLTVDSNNDVNVDIKSQELDTFLQQKGYKDQIIASLFDYLAETGNVEQALSLTKNEIAPYLIEAILDGNEANSSLSQKNQGLVKRVLKHLQTDKHLKSVAKNNKPLTRQLTKIRQAFDRGVRQVRIQENAMSFFSQNVVGKRTIGDMIDWAYVKNEFGIENTDENKELILTGLLTNLDISTGDVLVYGVQENVVRIPIQKLLLMDDSVQPKRLKQPNYNDIYQNTHVHPTKHRKTYRRLLWEFVEVQNEIIDMIIQEHGHNIEQSKNLWRPYQEMATLADHIHNELDKNKPLVKPSHVKLVRELVATDEFHKHEYNYRKRGTNDLATLEVRAAANAIQKFARHFNTKTGLVGWRNRTYSVDRESVASWSYEVTNKQNVFEVAEGLRSAIEISSVAQFPGEFTIGYTILNVLDGKTDVYYRFSEDGQSVSTVQTQDKNNVSPWTTNIDPNTKRYIEFYAKPTQKIIERNINKIEDKMYREDEKMPSKKYSIDSEGNAITPFTKQRFRNSVIRDEKGRLKVLYHGTQRAFFNEFDSGNPVLGRATNETHVLKGKNINFFTSKRSVAESYSGHDTAVPQEIFKKYETIKEFVETLQSLEDGDGGKPFEHYTVIRQDGKYQLVELNDDIQTTTKEKQEKIDSLLDSIVEFESQLDHYNNALDGNVMNGTEIEAYKKRIRRENKNKTDLENIFDHLIRMEEMVQEYRAEYEDGFSVEIEAAYSLVQQKIKSINTDDAADIEYIHGEYETREQLLKKAFEDIFVHQASADPDSMGGIYSVYLNMTNPYGIDAEGKDWADIIDPDGPGHVENTVEIIQRVLNMNEQEGTNYDGIIFNNVYDPFESSDVYVTIQSKDQIQIVERDESTSPKAINNQFVEDVFTFFTDQKILQGNQFLTREGLNVHEVTPDRMVLPTTYDSDNVVVGMPNFQNNNEIQALNDAAKVSPVVAFALPILWKENYTYQSKAPENMKLIFNKPYNPGVRLLGYYPGKATKLVGQIWVRKDDARFKTLPDIRKTKNDPIRHKDFKYYKLDRAAHFEAYKNFDFDFAVQMKGPATDFSQKITDFNKLDQTKNYVLIKANNERALDVLQNMDYNDLALYGSDIFIGFTGTDLVRAYTQKLNEMVGPKKLSEVELTEQDRAEIRRAMGEVDVSQFFKKDGRGKLVLKNEKIVKSQKRAESMMLNGKIYAAKEYAMSLNYGQEKDITIGDGYQIVKRNEMSVDESKLFDLFQSMDISFVFFHPTNKNARNTAGFSTLNSGTNVVFINSHSLNQQKKAHQLTENITNTLIHEEMHEMYKFNRPKAQEFGRNLSQVLFENANTKKALVKDAKATEVLEAVINAKWGSEGAFLKYLSGNYNEMRNVNSLADVQNILEKGQSKRTQVDPNEMIAQIVGTLFSDNNVINKIFMNSDGSTNYAKSIPAMNLYSTLANGAKNKNVRLYLQDSLKQFEILRQEHTKLMGKTFNKPTRYTLAELNAFVKSFTDEQYKTKNEMLRVYFKELANKKSGPAHVALDNLLFISKEFANIYKENVDNFNALQDEFANYKKKIDYVLTSKETATFLKSEPFAKFAALQKIFGKTGKTKQIKHLFDTQNMTADHINLILKHFSEVDNMLDALLYSYESIDQKLLDYFGMPDSMEIANMITNIRFELTNLVNEIQMNQNPAYVSQIDFQKYLDHVVDFMKEGQRLSSDATIDINTLQMIQRNMETIHVKKMNNVYKNIIDYVNNTLERFSQVTKQKESVYHNEIVAIKDAIIKYAELINEHMFDLNQDQMVIKDKFIDQLKAIDQIIKESTRIPEQEKLRIKDSVMGELYINTAVLLGDKTILTDRFPNSITYRYATIEALAPKGLKENALAKNFADVLKAAETRYTNFLSGHKKTTQEFVQQTTKEIDALPKPISVGLISRNVNLMLTQDYLEYFVKATDGKIEFFRGVYNEYIKAGLRRQDLLANFEQAYEAFIIENKAAVEHSHDTVELDSEFLVNMETKDQFIKTQQQAYEKAKTQQDYLKEIKTEIETLRKERFEAQVQIDEANRIYAKTTDTAIRTKQLQIKYAQQDIVDEKTKAINSLVKQTKVERDKLRGLLSEDFLVKKAFIEQANQPNYKNAKLSYGELITLYLSVKREIEMQQNYDNGDESIAPTNHFGFGNSIEVYDVKKAAEKGHLNAQNDMATVAINTGKEELLTYLEGLLTDQDMEIIDFVQKRFDSDYNAVNEMYKMQHQVDLPRQNTYILFQARDANLSREFRLREVNRHNTGVPDSMTKQTMHHASTALTITNVFDVVEMSARRSAMYSFEPLITDFHAAMETVSDSGLYAQSLKQKFTTQGNKVGENNKYYDAFDKGVRKIIQYGDPDETKFEKRVRYTTALGVTATVGFNIPMSFKQLPTITTTLIKMGRPDLILRMTKNVFQSLGKSKYRTWLMSAEDGKGNSQFYLRRKQGNIVSLVDTMPLGTLRGLNKNVKKVGYAMGALVGRFDNATLVGAMKTFAEDYRMKNPKATEAEVMNYANEQLNEMFLRGIANFDPAFRAPFSVSKRPLQRVVGRFMSENILQYSAMVKHLQLWLNSGAKDLSQLREVMKHFSALLVSALLSSVVNMAANSARGYTDLKEDDVAFELLVNQLMWNNMVGIIPYVNQFTGMIQWTKPQRNDAGQLHWGMNRGFDFNMPFIDDFFKMIRTIESMQNGQNLERKTLRIFENIGQMTGVPIRNAVRTARSISNIFSPTGSKQIMQVNQFFDSTTNQQALNTAVSKGRTREINEHIRQVFENEPVRNEIARLLVNNPETRLKLYGDPYFRVQMDDGSYKRYDIPPSLHKHYNTMAQRALQNLIRRFEYRRLSDEEKIKAIQRVINYYNRQLRNDVLGERVDLMQMLDVVAHSLRYSNT